MGAPFGIVNFIHSTKAKYFYKDVVWESVDRAVVVCSKIAQSIGLSIWQK
jgi:hypothetical protein